MINLFKSSKRKIEIYRNAFTYKEYSTQKLRQSQ